MIKKINYDDLGRNQGPTWLNSHFHFSFADYFNPNNINFGQLRVINDDLVQPHTGFTTHPHRDMEIISYVIDGNLSHKDSMGNERTLTRGQMQYMSAGTGILHSELNKGDEVLRFLQIWIFPDEEGYEPNYGDKLFTLEDRQDKLFLAVSNWQSNAPIKIHQDMNIYISETNKEIDFKVSNKRQAYLVLIEGQASINNHELTHGDALEIVEEDIKIIPRDKAHFIILEMAKEN
ncbi:MAG: pirin family protein [Bacilli bacterium]|jgi:redox-sensitive bicupin YhaK (pirin superfamily)|nr:pirin family protein [Bacilli bacterium]